MIFQQDTIQYFITSYIYKYAFSKTWHTKSASPWSVYIIR